VEKIEKLALTGMIFAIIGFVYLIVVGEPGMALALYFLQQFMIIDIILAIIGLILSTISTVIIFKEDIIGNGKKFGPIGIGVSALVIIVTILLILFEDSFSLFPVI
jgi:hypothetical protein